MRSRILTITPHRLPVLPLLALLLLAMFWVVAPALGADSTGDPAPQPPGSVLDGIPIGVILVGAGTQGLSYVLNHYAPWASEQFKGIAMVAYAAGAGLIYQLVSAGDFGWNTQTLVAVVEAVVSALAAHKLFYVTTGLNATLGAGSNASQPYNTFHPGLSAKSRSSGGVGSGTTQRIG